MELLIIVLLDVFELFIPFIALQSPQSTHTHNCALTTSNPTPNLRAHSRRMHRAPQASFHKQTAAINYEGN